MKIIIAGGGSNYIPALIFGIIDAHRSFPVSGIALVDLEGGAFRLSAGAGLSRRMIRKAGLDEQITINDTLNSGAALPGADFVITQFRIGGEARLSDEPLPFPYGIVGRETTWPGGFAAALRQIPPAPAGGGSGAALPRCFFDQSDHRRRHRICRHLAN